MELSQFPLVVSGVVGSLPDSGGSLVMCVNLVMFLDSGRFLKVCFVEAVVRPELNDAD